MKRPTSRRSVGLISAMVALSGVALACGVPAQDQATLAPDAQVPFGLLGTAAPATAPVIMASTVQVCLLRADRVEAVERPLDVRSGDSSPAIRLAAAATLLPAERALGYSTALTRDTVRDARATGATVAVSLDPGFTDLDGVPQLRAVAQIVCTLTAAPETAAVRFDLDGTPLDVPRGDGSSTSDPVTAADYAALIRPR